MRIDRYIDRYMDCLIFIMEFPYLESGLLKRGFCFWMCRKLMAILYNSCYFCGYHPAILQNQWRGCGSSCIMHNLSHYKWRGIFYIDHIVIQNNTWYFSSGLLVSNKKTCWRKIETIATHAITDHIETHTHYVYAFEGVLFMRTVNCSNWDFKHVL